MRHRRRKLALPFLTAVILLGLVALVWATGMSSSEAQQGAMHNCPLADKWAMAVWGGDSDTDADQALATCGEDALVAAYGLDPETNAWSHWFAERPDISNLTTLNYMQGIIALGGAGASASVSAASLSQQDAMQNCPLQDRWAISVWSGDDGTDASQALATCGEDAVVTAYGLDPESQEWSRSLPERPEISNLPALNRWQAILALGGPGAPATPTPTPTPTPSGRIVFVSDRDGNAEVYVMNADGSAQARLTDNPAHDGSPAWSPDASQIAFTSDRNGNYEIYVMNADGTDQTRLTSNTAEDADPAWSPDGSRIAFHSNRAHGNYEIYVMNADGTGQTNVTNNSAVDLSPGWSPDGSQIAFVSRRDGNDEVYVMNADGTDQTRLTDNPAFDYSPAWSPDGSQIAFTSHLDANAEVYVMNTDGTGQINLTTSAAFDLWPAWSPDGFHIAFTSSPVDGDHEIYVMGADGTGQSNLTDNTADDRHPDWSGVPGPAPTATPTATPTPTPMSFGPAFSCDVYEYAVVDAADILTEFTLPEDDAYFESLVIFTPSQFGVAADPDVPDGALVADVDLLATLGVFNNVCTADLSVAFSMLDATTNTADTVSLQDGFADADANGLPDAVNKYPDFLNMLFPGIVAHARYYGQSNVSGSPWSLNLLVFQQDVALPGLPTFDPSYGYPSVVILNDPMSPQEPSFNAVTDICTPAGISTTVLGVSADNPDTLLDESGYVVRTGPTAEDYVLRAFARSLRDADGDGIENHLDTCPFDVNEGDPDVAASGDDDLDGIDNACDPEPDEASSDYDDDLHLNRGDNCPLAHNPQQRDGDGDGIGDTCDPDPSTPDGDAIEVLLECES